MLCIKRREMCGTLLSVRAPVLVVGSTRGGRASSVHWTEVTAAERKKLRPGTKTTSIVISHVVPMLQQIHCVINKRGSEKNRGSLDKQEPRVVFNQRSA